ncbi:MAG: hypothetical protein Q9167_006676 [Letrouitia subvulpina]
MTAQVLTAELSALAQESKKRNADIRNAADKSLNDLKALPNTSEAQLAAALDIQLKILQALPSLLQNYAASINGRLLLAAFQLLSSTFEKVTDEDNTTRESSPSVRISVSGQELSIRSAASDAFNLMNDICILTEGEKSKALPAAALSQTFGLDLIESIAVHFGDTVVQHPEQVDVFRTRVIPLISKIISEKSSFSSTIRAMRLLQFILSRLLSAMPVECEPVLELMNDLLDLDSTAHWKRVLCLEEFRALHSEPALIRRIYAHYDEQPDHINIVRDHLASLVRLASEKPSLIGLGQETSVPESESGNSDEEAAVQAGGLVGTIGATATATGSGAPGITIKWSTVKTACIDLLDKSEAPALPPTYIYSLVLTCISSFSEGLAKFLLPFTLPSDGKSKRKQRGVSNVTDLVGSNRFEGETIPVGKPEEASNGVYQTRKLPINPLDLKEHLFYNQIQTSGQMIEHCWPAVLATCSTFLNATLDSDNYHELIRSFQKFTHVAGLLGFATPRDAFLTTLGKHSLPRQHPASPKTPNAPSPSSHNSDQENTDDQDTSPARSVASGNQKQSESSRAAILITSRNLLCLRALLNLGTALGPVLHKSWSIILETYQQADNFIPRAEGSNSKLGRQISQNNPAITVDLANEITAMEAAASRLFESTKDLTNPSFVDVVSALRDLLCGIRGILDENHGEGARKLLSPAATPRHHRGSSISIATFDGHAMIHGNIFALEKLGQLSKSNVARLAEGSTSKTGWGLLVEAFINTLGTYHLDPQVRLKAAQEILTLGGAVIIYPGIRSRELQDVARCRGLDALSTVVSSLQKLSYGKSKVSLRCDIEIHEMTIERLYTILENCGESLIGGWQAVFSLILSIFDQPSYKGHNVEAIRHTLSPKSLKLVKTSFASLQLINSDFLTSVPRKHYIVMLDAVYCFSAQIEDLNISLTATTLFRNISDFLETKDDQRAIDSDLIACKSSIDLAEIIKAVNRDVSPLELWVYLQLHLTLLTTDSALHTLFRIFDSYGENLDPSAWLLCFQHIIMKILSANHDQYDAKKDQSSWNGTAILIIEWIPRVFLQSMNILRNNASLQLVWEKLLQQFNIFLERENLAVGRAVFNTMTVLLSESNDFQMKNLLPMHLVWDLWQRGNPRSYTGQPMKGVDNNGALIAYLQLLYELHPRLAPFPDDYVGGLVQQLKNCVTGATPAVYNQDIDRMSEVQSLVLGGIRMMPTEGTGALTATLKFITSSIVLAFRDEGRGLVKGKTYVALSKSAMDELQPVVIDHCKRTTASPSKILADSLRALAVPLQLKYKWPAEGKEPSTWKKATTTALEILEATLPYAKHLQDEYRTNMWESIISITSGIISVDSDTLDNISPSAIIDDERFDLSAFSRMQALFIPALGSSDLLLSIREQYVSSIFTNSLIHETHPDDLALPGQPLLSGLSSTHIGRVQDLPPTPRSKLSYVLTDTLFALVSVKSSSSATPETIALAKTTAPYLVLRVGLVLKAYVYDQPLRGRAPQPRSQKLEMQHVLQKLVELQAEPEAMSEIGLGWIEQGLGSENGRAKTREESGEAREMKQRERGSKGVLYRLYGLLVQALNVAARDEEMAKLLRGCLEVVGRGF